MGLSVANILLEVTGNSDSARRELADVARDLALFSREEAEAAAYLDTTEAQADLDDLKLELARFSANDVSTEVNLKIAKAQADLAALKADLEKIDHEDVDVDVDVKRGVVERMGALAKQVADLGDELNNSSGFASTFAKGLGSIFASLTTLGPVLIAIALMIGTSLVAALAALVASLTQAVGGLGALAIAFTGALVPGVLLAIGAIAQFKEDSETAGTAAHSLREAASGLFDTFKSATADGADALFRGLADAARDLNPLVEALGPAFTRLGQAGGQAFSMLAEHFSSPEWQKFFIGMTDSLAKLTPLFARSFGAWADIMRNIATAAMPFLIAGFRSLAEWLEGIGDSTSNIRDLRGSIGGLVDQLGVWLDLTGSIGGAFLAFVQAAAPAGKAIAEWISDVADGFSEWANSEQGRARIQSFFEDVLPIAKEFLTLLGHIAVIVLQVTQFFAPLITLVLHGMNKIASAISDVLEWLIKLDRSVSFDAIKDVLLALPRLIADIVSKPIEFAVGFAGDVGAKARDLWNFVKGVITDGIKFVIEFANDIASRARNIWRDVKSAITNSIKFVIGFIEGIVSRARGIWQDVKGVITDLIRFLFGLPSDMASRARGVWDDVKGVIGDTINFILGFAGDIVGRAKDLWSKVKDAVSAGIDLVIHLVPDVSGLPGKVADVLGFANGVENLWESMFAMVGENGPELAFLPQGTDIYTASETRRILKALGQGAAAPATSSAVPVAGGSSQVVNNYDVKVVSPGTGSPDPDVAAALWDAKLRAKGVLTG